MSRKAFAVFLLFLLISLLSCSGQIVVLTYNVENLFDDRSDDREYSEYRGENWNTELYHRKLSALARAIKAASPGGPDVLCLQEIESRVALSELRDRYLKNMGYRYLVFVPQKSMATTVACLSRLPVLHTRVHAVGSFDGRPLRHILEVQLSYEGSTLYLFNNHWKSKTGGVDHTAPARRLAAKVLVERVREILVSVPSADLLVLGDFNENLDEYDQIGRRYRTAILADEVPGTEFETDGWERQTLFVTSSQSNTGLQEDRLVLYDLWYELPPTQRGSSVYQGRWQTPDRLFLSPGLFDEAGFAYRRNSFRVVKEEFLLDPNSGFPLRWRAGAGHAGTSDHLPLTLGLSRSR
jgi:endonuclease/exonuclease/phosphatase family metal-dependent hydrolase